MSVLCRTANENLLLYVTRLLLCFIAERKGAGAVVKKVKFKVQQAYVIK